MVTAYHLRTYLGKRVIDIATLIDYVTNKVKKEKIKLMDVLNLWFLKKLQPHRTQILWGCRQGSYPLALYVWSVPKTRVPVAFLVTRQKNVPAVLLRLNVSA